MRNHHSGDLLSDTYMQITRFVVLLKNAENPALACLTKLWDWLNFRTRLAALRSVNGAFCDPSSKSPFRSFMEPMNSSQCENKRIPLWFRGRVSKHKLSITISNLSAKGIIHPKLTSNPSPRIKEQQKNMLHVYIASMSSSGCPRISLAVYYEVAKCTRNDCCNKTCYRHSSCLEGHVIFTLKTLFTTSFLLKFRYQVLKAPRRRNVSSVWRHAIFCFSVEKPSCHRPPLYWWNSVWLKHSRPGHWIRKCHPCHCQI